MSSSRAAVVTLIDGVLGPRPGARSWPHAGRAPEDPRWARPALIAILALAAGLLLWELPENGWANAYYSSAVRAATHSWDAFWTASLDTSRTVSIDKPPLAIWMMAVSARIFGFSPGALLVPNALCMLGSVALVYALGRRTFGVSVGLLAALFMALTPVTIVVGRFNNPDSLLVLLLLCAAWWAVRMTESGRLRDALLCGAFVGLAFNTKMLQAYLVLPAFAAALLAVDGRAGRSRLALMASCCFAALLVSGLWIGAMSIIPATARPWVGDTTNDSWWQLSVAANGLGRLAGALPAGHSGAGPFRLLGGSTGGQIAWLFPLAASGVVAGVVQARRHHHRRPGIVLWIGWVLVHLLVFSIALGLFHAYYTSAMAPALALLAAVGASAIWKARIRSPGVALAAVVVTFASVLLGVMLLQRAPGFLPWLPLCLCAAGLIAVGSIVMAVARGRSPWWPRIAAVVALTCILAGPAAYSLVTTERQLGGINPLAGPGPYEEPVWSSDDATGRTILVRYLVAHQGRARYLAAVSGALAGAPITLLSGRPIVTMGGFAGSDPAPSPTRLAALVRRGEVRTFVLAGLPSAPAGASPAGLGGEMARTLWVTAHCQRVPLSPMLPTPDGGSLRARVYSCGPAAGHA